MKFRIITSMKKSFDFVAAIIVSLIVVVIIIVLIKHGFDLDKAINVLLGVLITLALKYIYGYIMNKRKAKIRAEQEMPYFTCHSNLTENATITAETICLCVPEYDNKNGDSNALESKPDSGRNKPFFNCSATLFLKNSSHSDFIIDSLSFILEKSNDARNIDNKKLTIYRIYPGSNSFIEKNKNYKIEIDLENASNYDLNEGEKGILGIVIKDTTLEKNTYFFPIFCDNNIFKLGDKMDVSDINNNYFGKIPSNIAEPFSFTSFQQFLDQSWNSIC